MQVTHQARSYTLSLAALATCFILSAGPAVAQTQERPVLSPEHMKLQAWVGEWSYEGSIRETPLGPAGKFTGTETSRLILDGLFLERKSKDTTGIYAGKEIPFESVGITWYDPATKSYKNHSYDTDGYVSEGIMTVSGNTWTLKGMSTDQKGKSSPHRSTLTFSADGKVLTVNGEISLDDGRTWTPYYDLTLKKVGN